MSLKRFALIVLFFELFLTPSWAMDRQQAFVQEVLSGDTVQLKGGKILKYAGLEAPPLQHLIPLIRTYGENAKSFNAGLVLNKNIWIEWGPRLRDPRGNLLGYVYLEDGTYVNFEILKAGHAKPYIVPPNLKDAEMFKKAALLAQRNSLGLWKQAPKNPFLKQEYVGEKNTKIYYLSNSPQLERIPQANLVSFRSRVEASAAGYRACDSCRDAGANSEFETLY